MSQMRIRQLTGHRLSPPLAWDPYGIELLYERMPRTDQRSGFQPVPFGQSFQDVVDLLNVQPSERVLITESPPENERAYRKP